MALNDQHLERVLDVFVEHYNCHSLIERWLSLRPARHVNQWSRRRCGAKLVSSVAIVLAVWFTSTSWRRDQLSAPYTRTNDTWWIAGSRDDVKDNLPS